MNIRISRNTSWLKSINEKRLTRGAIKVGLEMVNIAGDIATLSGVGAEAGVPLKAAAAGVSASMAVARNAKQLGRNITAKTGEHNVMRKIFNADKSSAKKTEKRDQHATLIMQMIADLPEFDAGKETIVEQYQRVEDFISASGISPAALYRLNGKPKKQRELLMDGMKKRG